MPRSLYVALLTIFKIALQIFKSTADFSKSNEKKVPRNPTEANRDMGLATT